MYIYISSLILLKLTLPKLQSSALIAAALNDESMGSSDEDVVAPGADRGSADEDEESIDEDFQADTESDPAEEFDSAHESSGSGTDDGMDEGDDDDDEEDAKREEVKKREEKKKNVVAVKKDKDSKGKVKPGEREMVERPSKKAKADK